MKIKTLNGLSLFLHALLDSRYPFLAWASLLCFVTGIISGWSSYFALLHNVPLNGVVEFFGNGDRANRGSTHMEYLSALIAYSVFGFLGGVVFLIVWRRLNKKLPHREM